MRYNRYSFLFILTIFSLSLSSRAQQVDDYVENKELDPNMLFDENNKSLDDLNELDKSLTNSNVYSLNENYISEPNFRNSTLTTKCFPDLGCVASDDFFDTLKTVPLMFTDPQELNVTFNLFTRNNRDVRQVFDYKASQKKLNKSWFRAYRKTKFIIHGYMSGFDDTDWMNEMKDFLLNFADYNVFAIDWSKGAHSINYFQSAADTRVVGLMVANFITQVFVATKHPSKDIHCIGHSLGAHICGFTGQRLKVLRLGHISGLDPAGPGFNLNDTETRLDSTDAKLVVVMHTSAGIVNSNGIDLSGFLGNTNNLGHYDFWPNGGAKQPGCGLSDTGIMDVPTCSHGKAYQYFTSQMQSECQMIGYQCPSYDDFESGKCADCGGDGSKCKPMEFNPHFWDSKQLNVRDVQNDYEFYIKTNDSEPYCLFHYQFVIQIDGNSSKSAPGQIDIELSNGKSFSIKKPIKGFKAGLNYTNLFVDSNQFEPNFNITLKWSSLFRYTLKVDEVFVNFMSDLNQSVRRNKSKRFCPTVTTILQNGDSLLFDECSQTNYF